MSKSWPGAQNSLQGKELHANLHGEDGEGEADSRGERWKGVPRTGGQAEICPNRLNREMVDGYFL